MALCTTVQYGCSASLLRSAPVSLSYMSLSPATENANLAPILLIFPRQLLYVPITPCLSLWVLVIWLSATKTMPESAMTAYVKVISALVPSLPQVKGTYGFPMRILARVFDW